MFEARLWKLLRNSEAQPKFTLSYKKKYVYKVHGGPNFFPTIQIWTRISSLHIILIFASRPLNKGEKCVFIAFLS